MLNYLAVFISGVYLGFAVARRWPRLLASKTKPLTVAPLTRYEFRPPVAVAEAHHRELWASRMLRFMHACERVSEARRVPPRRVPSLETLRIGIGISKRAAGRYLDVLESGGLVETVPYAGSYWTTGRAARRSALAGLPYPAGAKPPRF